ncbi:MAG: pyridoxal 5'-phosphate synthase glutaminase subunit PdxT [Prevotella sp.]|nr:pyridoxal 5'-phosphate synthase glutaminase subunit PdxT [Prevotella sp.]
MRVAVLALQGAFIEHERRLTQLGAEVFEVRQLADWEQAKDALIIPGGESTTQTKLLTDLGLMEPIRQAIKNGLPVFGTCAGLILLAKDVESERREYIATMDMTVCRNAYGRQLGSFHTVASVAGVGDDIPMTFIRAPYIKEVSGTTKALATVDGHIVAAQQDRQLVTAFHPELDPDTRLHEYFLRLVRGE